MKKINKIIFVFCISILLISCGYKKISQTQQAIYLQNITTSGENRTAYALKNDILLISDKNAKIKYDVDLKISQSISTRIKNSAGKVTRDRMAISVNLFLKNINNQKTLNKSFSRNSDYDIASTHSKTLNNRKATKKNLINQLSDDIKKFILIYSEIK